jgi:nucleotide-binding universal stress UspA family protein
MKLQHIVVASDLSEASRQAQRHAARLACCSGGRVTVLHVDEVGQYRFRSTDEMNCYVTPSPRCR